MTTTAGSLAKVIGGLLFGLAALAEAGAAFASDEEKSADKPAVTQELPLVSLAQAVTGEVQSRVPLSGSLVARQEVMIYPRVSGYAVTQIFADVGDQVEAGQELALLQDQTLSAQVKQAEAEYERAEAGVKQAQSQILSAEASLTEAATALDRTRRLRAGGTSSQAQLDQAVASEASANAAAASAHDGLSVAQAALAQASASRDIARLNLDYTRVTAPVAGLVATRNAELGALSGNSTEPMFTVIAGDEIELAADVIETAIPALRIGAPVDLRIAGVGEVTGKVRLPPATVDPVTRLGSVRISLDPDPRLRPGLFASGSVVVDKKEALTVPTTAVLVGENGNVVQVVRDGTIELRPVTAGLIWDGRREIAAGLSPGESVVARAGAFFRTGDRIRTAAQAAPKGAGAATSDAAAATPTDAQTDAATASESQGAEPSSKDQTP